MRKRKYSISYFTCPNCDNVIPLPRRSDRQREANHIKDLWCVKCRCKMKFVEERNSDCVKNMLGEML